MGDQQGATRSRLPQAFGAVYFPATLAEIPFGSLRQIRDLARRAYLSAGLGPGSPGAIAGAVPSPTADSGPGGAYLELRTEELDEEWPVGPEVTSAPPAVLDTVVREFALASLLAWDGPLEGAEAAEVALEAFIDACLGGPPSFPSTPHAVPEPSDAAEAALPQADLGHFRSESPRQSRAYE